MSTHLTAFRNCARVANCATHKFKIGAVIIKSGRIISTGFNRTNSYSAYLNYNRISKWTDSVHAEQSAILHALKSFDGLKHLVGATLYVTRISSKNQIRLAKPCKYCMELIRSVGISKVIYTTSEQTIETIKGD